MTNKRYSMFKSEITGLFCIADENHKETFCGMDNEYNCMRIINILNQKEERIKELEKENTSMKDRIFNAMIKSNQVECDCTTCVCEDYVYEELKKW